MPRIWRLSAPPPAFASAWATPGTALMASYVFWLLSWRSCSWLIVVLVATPTFSIAARGVGDAVALGVTCANGTGAFVTSARAAGHTGTAKRTPSTKRTATATNLAMFAPLPEKMLHSTGAKLSATFRVDTEGIKFQGAAPQRHDPLSAHLTEPGVPNSTCHAELCHPEFVEGRSADATSNAVCPSSFDYGAEFIPSLSRGAFAQDDSSLRELR